MRRLKTIDELYEEVKGYGLVITNDVALETALNARIETSRLGELAVTPRHLVARFASRILGVPIISDLKLMAAVSEETGFALRRVYSEILNFREIRSHTKDVRQHLGTRTSKAIYDSYCGYPTLEKAMGLLDPDDEDVAQYFQGMGNLNSAAVIAPEFFDDLDKHCVPLDAETIEIFTDDEYDIPEIRAVGNDRQLAENAVWLIDEENPTDYAIVLSARNPIADSVRSALYRRGIPFINGMKVSDVPHVRDFIRFVELAIGYRTLRIRQIREIFSNYGGSVPPKTDNYLLSRIDLSSSGRKATVLKELMERIGTGDATYREIKDIICNTLTKPQVSLFLEELDMLDRTADPESLAEIRFAVENVAELTLNVQRPESECRGVLIADSRNSVYVDRPVVIYLGMEQEWNIPVIGKRYIDAESESELNAQRLEALLQQGQRRLYCVNITRNGKDARPCLSFDILTGHACNRFSDVCGNIVRGSWSRPALPSERIDAMTVQGFDDDADGDDRPDAYGSGPFSKSSFDAFIACPRRFMFHELLPSSEKTFTQFGNLIHSFAELYATHPEVIDDPGLDALTDMAAGWYAGLSSPTMTGLDRDRIRSAMESIRRYIDTLPEKPPLDVQVPTDRVRNPFMRELGITSTSSWCEREKRFDEHHIHGTLDLQHGAVITDYKTGKAQKASGIRKSMSLSPVDSMPEFQPLIYLALGRQEHGDDAEFDLFYAMENDVAALEPGFDIERSVRRVRLLEGDALKVVASPDFYGVIKPYGTLGPHAEKVADAIRESGISDPNAWKGNDELTKSILKACGLSGCKTNVDNARKTLDKFADAIVGGIATERTGDSRTVVVMSEALDGFLESVDAQFERKEGYRRTGFPPDPAPRIDCEKCEYFDVCTMAKARVSQEADGDERSAKRFPEEDGRGPRRHGGRRCGAGDRQDEDRREQVHQPGVGRGGSAGDTHDDLHQERRRGDGGAHQGRHVRAGPVRQV